MLTENEMLKYALDNGIIDFNTIQTKIEMNERRKFLEKHESRIWQSTDGKWYTYLPDVAKGKKLIKRSTEDALKDAIIEHYKNTEEEPTIECIFHKWIDEKLEYGEIQKQTYDRYIVDFQKFFVASEFSNKKIRYIDEITLEHFCKGQIRDNQLTSKGWANLRLLVRAIFKYAKRRGYTKFDVANFMSYLELSKTIFRHSKKKASDNIFNEVEIKQIVDYCFKKPTLSNMAVLFAAYTGMRVGEIVALKWEDIGKDIIYVHRTQVTYKDEHGKNIHTIKDDTKTEAGNREVVIIPQLREVLRRLRVINPFTEYVFQIDDGKTVLKNTICKNLHIICDNLGIKRRGVHTLRKTFITNMINANVEEAIILEQVGHTMLQTSKEYYYYNDKMMDYMSDRVSKAIAY